MNAQHENYSKSQNGPIGSSSNIDLTSNLSHPDGGVLEEYAWMVLNEYWENVKNQYMDIDSHVSKCGICSLQVAESQNVLEELVDEQPSNLGSIGIRDVVRRLMSEAIGEG